jgi:hypothetical protein
VVHDGKLTESIKINSGVKQGCILSLSGFQLASDRVVRNVLKGRKRGIRWGLNGRLEDLDFADDICLLSARFRDMEIKMTKLREEANNGRKINAEKTKEMSINSNIEAKITLKGTAIEQVVSLFHLGSIFTKSGGAEGGLYRRTRQTDGTSYSPVFRLEE